MKSVSGELFGIKVNDAFAFMIISQDEILREAQYYSVVDLYLKKV